MVKGMFGLKRLGVIIGVTFVPVAVVGLLVVLGSVVTAGLDDAFPIETETAQHPMVVQTRDATQDDTLQDAFVFRFDPALGSFETFTVPTQGANPHSVAVRSGGAHWDVWFTEPAADQIGRLVYTGTNDYAFSEYTMTLGTVKVGHEPLNLAVDGNYVWFTARRGNFIGRVAPDTGEIVAFTGLTTASQPAGIDVAPDGSVWFAEMAADRIGHLVVTTTNDYEITEYPINRTGVGANAVEVQSGQYVWFAETATGRLTRLKIADGSMNIFVSLGTGSYPFDLLYDVGPDYLWVTESQRHRISQIELTTNKLQNSYDVPPGGGAPRGLTQVGSNHFWFTQYESGQIARLVYTSPTDVRFETFTLPVKGLFVPDIAAADDGALWIVAYRPPYQVNLPVLTRDYDDGPPPPFGVQMYGSVNHTSGLSEMIAADVRWIRVPVSWASVEPEDVTPDRYNWSSIDALVAAIAGADVEPLLTLGGNPRWAAVYPMGPVTKVAALQEFMRALVERYDGDHVEDAPGSPVVRYWEIYNEPDLADEWRAQGGGYGYFGYNGAAYAALLDAIYPVVKEASPKAQVVFGGLSSDNFDFEGGPTDPDFIDDVLSNCTSACFDVMNFHYFPYFRFRWESYGRDVIGKAEYLRSKMADYGFDRPVMCTEATWYKATDWGSESLQTRYVIPLFARGMAAGLTVTNWFAWKDIDSGLPGLLDAQLQPKPAYYVFRTLTQQLGQAEFKRPLSTAETGHADIEGYVFSVPFSNGYERRDVVWLDCQALRSVPPQDCPGASRSMTVRADVVRVTGKFGVSRMLEDSDDGVTNGLVTLTITPDPIFIDYTP